MQRQALLQGAEAAIDVAEFFPKFIRLPSSPEAKPLALKPDNLRAA